MSYDALYFALFLAITFVVFKALPWRGPVLLLASMLFYSVAGLRDCLLAGALVLVNYSFQWLILRDRRWLAAALATNFAGLAYFKYRLFFGGLIGVEVSARDLVIPLGISFYVFQLSGFLIDLSRGKAQPFTSLPQFLLFKLFFGQLVAGPITRWRQFGPQVRSLFAGHRGRSKLLVFGLALCLLGLAKKIVLADSLAPLVDVAFVRGPTDAAAAWLGAWLFAFQIYFDFSGYSDIAVGLGYLFGLRLPLNFRQPYLARSPQEFWQRWHITLSQWIRDFLYIPLGGSHGGWLRRAAVMLITMGLAGLWHGANWTFIIWGLGWGAMILLWRHPLAARLPVVAGWGLTLLGVLVLWVFFRASEFTAALAYLTAMFGGGTGSFALPTDSMSRLLIGIGCLALLMLHRGESVLFTRSVTLWLKRHDGALLRGFLVGLAFWLLLIPKTYHEPFIYFRF